MEFEFVVIILTDRGDLFQVVVDHLIDINTDFVACREKLI